jgi:metal-dependent amidase/aminoacylase/carboxypeptidase family protein
MPILNRIADRADAVAAWRRDLHAHPELQFEVHRTAAYRRREAWPSSASTRW